MTNAHLARVHPSPSSRSATWRLGTLSGEGRRPEEAAQTLANYRIYAADRVDDLPPTRVVDPDGREWSSMQPRGIAYWEVLARLVNEEPVHERDRITLATLERLGIVKGRPFTPDQRQRRLLEEATVVGEAMTRAIGYAPRFEGATIYPGRDWKITLFLDASQESEHTTQLDKRAAWFYEALTASKGMTTTTPGQGQAYLHVGRDADGAWLTGEHSYDLHVPADAPVEQFWSFTAYTAPAFALGWIVGLPAATAVVVLIADPAGAADDGGKTWVGALKIAFGLLFFLMAVKQWRNRPKPGQAALPGWMKAIDAMPAGKRSGSAPCCQG